MLVKLNAQQLLFVGSMVTMTVIIECLPTSQLLGVKGLSCKGERVNL